jgi:DNA mismatch endonuclease (patch repair protein)
MAHHGAGRVHDGDLPRSRLEEEMKAPSYSAYRPSSERASRALAGSHATDTTCERVLGSALSQLGMRFRKHYRRLPGRPDVVFPRARVVVFCDGDFWHGRKWQDRRRRLREGANPTYWTAKIAANMARDEEQTTQLRKMGWRVVRLWESDILRDPVRAAELVAKTVRKKLAR